MAKSNIKVGIVMGSDSDLPIMVEAAKICKEFSVDYELTIVSAHRTPERLFEYAKTAQTRGLQIIIAGAGGAAHLPGMLASLTHLPIIGVPILSSNSIGGWDSILSILQMPGGVPVATVALNGAKNAGLLAIKILALNHENLQTKLNKFSEKQIQKVESSIQKTQNKFPNQFD